MSGEKGSGSDDEAERPASSEETTDSLGGDPKEHQNEQSAGSDHREEAANVDPAEGPTGSESLTAGEPRESGAPAASLPPTDANRDARTSKAGVPSEGHVVSDRFSSDEVFQRIIAAADEEITSGWRELFFSGVAGGLAISITFLLYASMTASTDGHPILSVLLYPIGFIYIIIGGYQLYTENTLPPVALTLERLASVTALLRHWVIVLAGNFAGGAIGALVLAWTGVFSPEAAIEAEQLARKGIDEGWWNLFFKGAFAGLIVAGVVWVEYASRDTISRLVVIYLAFLAIPLGNLFHVVVSFSEMTYLLLLGEVGLILGMSDFVIPVLLGNTIGGVVLVTVINYYQTSKHRLGSLSGERRITRLSHREWIFGGYVGRSYVPIIEHHEPSPTTTDDAYRILVPISNVREEQALVGLATELASQQPGGTVHLAHMVQLPPHARSRYKPAQREQIRRQSTEQLKGVIEPYKSAAVSFETSTVVSYRTFEEMFNQARQNDADLVIMGWGTDKHWDTLRTGRPLDELTSNLPCDFLVMKDRDFDASRILLPTAGGPDSGLSAEVAVALRESVGAEITLLHIVDGEDNYDRGQEFLESWGNEHQLPDTERRVDTSGNVEQAIVDAATDHSVLILGATERGMLRRLATDSLHIDVIDKVDCSVLLAERPNRRSLFGRLFGSGRRKKTVTGAEPEE